MNTQMLYSNYNREERNLCSHLFRVLHEPKNDHQILKQFIGDKYTINNFNIYSEVALIRDAYHIRKKTNVDQFIDELVSLVMKQEGINDCKLYSKLDEDLKIHPRLIKNKGQKRLSKDETTVYTTIQSMFSAKPDLAITLDNVILVYEAKYTLGFDKKQLKLTCKIAEVWSKLLYKDLGYKDIPETKVIKLGLNKFKPDISWEAFRDIAGSVLGNNDKSYVAIYNAIKNSKD